MNNLKTSKKIPLKPLYDLTFEDSIHLVEVVAKNRLLVNFGDSPKVLLLNERLEILESKDLQASNNHVCISENGQYIGVSK